MDAILIFSVVIEEGVALGRGYVDCVVDFSFSENRL